MELDVYTPWHLFSCVTLHPIDKCLELDIFNGATVRRGGRSICRKQEFVKNKYV